MAHLSHSGTVGRQLGRAIAPLAGVTATAAAFVTGHGSLGMAFGGGALAAGSVGLAIRVVSWFDRPHAAGTELWWDVVLVGLVIGCLIGLGLMALSLPT